MERLLITIPPAIPMVALLGAGDANILAIEAAFPY
jgi:phosphate starvation-inducible protein PhoH and related proteins